MYGHWTVQIFQCPCRFFGVCADFFRLVQILTGCSEFFKGGKLFEFAGVFRGKIRFLIRVFLKEEKFVDFARTFHEEIRFPSRVQIYPDSFYGIWLKVQIFALDQLVKFITLISIIYYSNIYPTLKIHRNEIDNIFPFNQLIERPVVEFENQFQNLACA